MITPHAWSAACTVVGPTKRKPVARRRFASAVDAGDEASQSACDRGTFGRREAPCQTSSSQRRSRLTQRQRRARVRDRRVDLPPVPDDRGVREQPFDVALPEPGDRFGVEPAERLADASRLPGSSATRAPTGSLRASAVRRDLARRAPAAPTPRRGRRRRADRRTPSSESGVHVRDHDHHHSVPDDDLVRVDGLERRQGERPSRAQVERRPVPGADHATGVLLPFALAQRAVVVRAPILEGKSSPPQF